ncbi:hypothetical protein NDU88_003319 [Pleurodeles waltl]|uniref:Uncharacterized protein n=1 Tax=Pleurodeles waltl TaxID=8319 RepID=A0AAV7NHV9_PLEWA|nr:hypothetical protein NDU88_003319 [Pleurodeles waltl]
MDQKGSTLERAHRVPSLQQPPGAPPIPVVTRLLHFKDRDHILQRAQMGLKVKNKKVGIFPDFSREVQRQRAALTTVKKRLREAGIIYSMQLPARLRVVTPTGIQFFATPEEAWDWAVGNPTQARADHLKCRKESSTLVHDEEIGRCHLGRPRHRKHREGPTSGILGGDHHLMPDPCLGKRVMMEQTWAEIQ